MLYNNSKAFERIVNYIESDKKFSFLKKKKTNTLENVASGNAETLNRRKKENIELSKIYKKMGEADRAHRVAFCCSYRYVLVDSNKRAHNCHTVRCRDRHCSECAKIKSYIYQERLKRTAIETIKNDYKDDRFLFLTFTVKNPNVHVMRKAMRAMSKAFAKMNQRKAFRDAMRGGIRCFEVTRGQSKNLKNHCHPHIHAITQIKGEAFDLFKNFVDFSDCKNDKEKLQKLKIFFEENWTDCIKQEFEKEKIWNEEDYIKTKNRAVVDVKLVRAGGEKDAPILRGSDFAEFGDKVINYVLKYSLKEDDKRIFTGDKWSQVFDKQIKGMRMIAPFGLWRSELSKEEKAEYNEEEYFKRFEKVDNESSFLAKFNTDKKEYLTESVDVSELKRVKRSMLCIPLTYKNEFLRRDNKQLRKELRKAQSQTYSSIYEEVETINKIIKKINENNDIIKNNFEKLCQYGEYVKGERFYIKTYSQPENFYNPLDLKFQDNNVLDAYKKAITKNTENYKHLIYDYLNMFNVEKIDSYEFTHICEIDIEEYAEILNIELIDKNVVVEEFDEIF